MGLRLTADGLALDRVDVVTRQTAGVRLAATLDEDEPTFFAAAAWAACVADPALFTDPLRPLIEIVEDYGLAHRGEWLAPSGFDFDRWQFERRCELLAERYGLDLDDALSLTSLVEMYDRVSLLLIEANDEGEANEGPAIDSADDADDGLTVWPESSGPHSPTRCWLSCWWPRLSAPTAAVRPRWACSPRCWSRECHGRHAWRVGGWVRWHSSESATSRRPSANCWRPSRWIPDWPLPLIDLARIASDRGDVERGLGLLRRAGAGPDHPMVELLQAHWAEPRRDLGRNDPCWCGSGRNTRNAIWGASGWRLPSG